MYKHLAKLYLKQIKEGKNKIHLFSNKDIYIEWKKNYSGKMASIAKEFSKCANINQGYYDFKVHFTNGYNILVPNKDLTHKELFFALKEKVSFGDCFEVWRGIPPKKLTENPDKLFLLNLLLLFFFEQEINWGNLSWQRFSNFAQDLNNPYKCQPRNMIMGFLIQIYLCDDYSKSDLKKYEYKGSYSFGQYKWRGYENKQFFNVLNNQENIGITFDADLVKEFEMNITSVNPFFVKLTEASLQNQN